MSLSLFKSQKLQDRMELVEIEGTEGLTPFENLFCLYTIQGVKAGNAYMQAALKMDLREQVDKNLATKRAYALLKQERIIDHMAKYTALMEKYGVASGLELQMFLTDAILTPLSAIDEHSPLCKGKKITKRYDKDGNLVSEEIHIEKICPLKSVDMLARMKGMYAPIKVDMRHSGGVMVVPMTTNLDEWEVNARESQAALMADAVDI